MSQAVAAGTVGIVVVDGDLDSRPMPSRTLTFTNRSGGTAFLPKGKYLVRLNDRGFHDYETGAVLHGNLIAPAAIELAREIGTTEYDSNYWKQQVGEGRPHSQEHYNRVLEAEANFDPSYVRFHYFDEGFGRLKNFYPLPEGADPTEFAESCE